jgi:hypothetical protein
MNFLFFAAAVALLFWPEGRAMASAYWDFATQDAQHMVGQAIGLAVMWVVAHF